MRLVSFLANGAVKVGAEWNDGIVDVQAAVAAHLEAQGDGDPLVLSRALAPSDMVGFVRGGRRNLDAAKAALGWLAGRGAEQRGVAGAQLHYGRSEVKVLAPLSPPGTIYAIGRNYLEHQQEEGSAQPPSPAFFGKFRNSVIGPDEPIVIPSDLTAQVDWEVELALVIGRKGKRIAKEDALAYIFGYTILNDISARDLQFVEPGQWVKGKTPDTFAPMGPVLVTADELPDAEALNLSLTVNGETRQSSNTRMLIFKIADLIAYLSKLVTLEPGDVISTGTPSGVGFARKPPVFLKGGDEVVCEVEKIGRLRNPVVIA